MTTSWVDPPVVEPIFPILLISISINVKCANKILFLMNDPSLGGGTVNPALYHLFQRGTKDTIKVNQFLAEANWEPMLMWAK